MLSGTPAMFPSLVDLFFIELTTALIFYSVEYGFRKRKALSMQLDFMRHTHKYNCKPWPPAFHIPGEKSFLTGYQIPAPAITHLDSG